MFCDGRIGGGGPGARGRVKSSYLVRRGGASETQFAFFRPKFMRCLEVTLHALELSQLPPPAPNRARSTSCNLHVIDADARSRHEVRLVPVARFFLHFELCVDQVVEEVVGPFQVPTGGQRVSPE